MVRLHPWAGRRMVPALLLLGKVLVMKYHACRRQVQPADSRRLLKDSDARQEQGSDKGARRSGLWNRPCDAVTKKAIHGSLFLSSQGAHLPICQGLQRAVRAGGNSRQGLFVVGRERSGMAFSRMG
ncbi:hypothetical protein BLX41_19445 [Pseudomonas protegens]|nr:hypothetical protein BLX41_19445 [Pseudomonas protegens]